MIRRRMTNKQNFNLCNWFCFGITLLLVIFGKSLLGFATSNETAYLPPYLLDYLVGRTFHDV